MAWPERRVAPPGGTPRARPNGDRAPRRVRRARSRAGAGRDQQPAQRPADNPAAAQAPGLARTPAAIEPWFRASSVSAQRPGIRAWTPSPAGPGIGAGHGSARAPVPARDSMPGQTPARPRSRSRVRASPAQDSAAGHAPVPLVRGPAYGAVLAAGLGRDGAPHRRRPRSQPVASARAGPGLGGRSGRDARPRCGRSGAAVAQAHPAGGRRRNERRLRRAREPGVGGGGSAAPRRRQPPAFARASPFAPSLAFASRQSLGAASARGHDAPLAAPLSAPVAPAAPPLGESDELFRAWQGSVREAAGGARPGRQPAAAPVGGERRARLGWQVAKIGVPAAVIVTVGAGALLMLTGRANEMLAERSNTGAQPPGQPGVTAATGQPAAATAGLILAGYPGQHGPVAVAAMWSAGGTTMAVGYADAHPAVWRHAANGTWSLVSAAALGGLTGHLTSVAKETSGWIAVGSANENGTDEPVVFWSPDGVTWSPLPALTGIAGARRAVPRRRRRPRRVPGRRQAGERRQGAGRLLVVRRPEELDQRDRHGGARERHRGGRREQRLRRGRLAWPAATRSGSPPTASTGPSTTSPSRPGRPARC